MMNKVPAVVLLLTCCFIGITQAQTNEVTDANCNVQRLRTESVTTSSGLWGGMEFLVQLHYETCTDLTTNQEGEVTDKVEAAATPVGQSPLTGSRISLTIDNETTIVPLVLEAEDEESEVEREVEYSGIVRIPGKDELGGVSYLVTVDEEGVVRMSSRVLFRDSEETEMPLCEKSRIGEIHACYVENLMPTLIVGFFLVPAALCAIFLFRAKQKKESYLQELRQQQATEMKRIYRKEQAATTAETEKNELGNNKAGEGKNAEVEDYTHQLQLVEDVVPTFVMTTASKVDPKCTLKPSEVDVVLTLESVLLTIKFSTKNAGEEGFLQVVQGADGKMHLWQRRGHSTNLMDVDGERNAIKTMAQSWEKLAKQYRAKPSRGFSVPDFAALLGAVTPQKNVEVSPRETTAFAASAAAVDSSPNLSTPSEVSSSPPFSKQSTMLYRDDSATSGGISTAPNSQQQQETPPKQTINESERRALEASEARKQRDEEAVKAKKVKEEEQRAIFALRKEHDGQRKDAESEEQHSRVAVKDDEKVNRTTFKTTEESNKQQVVDATQARLQAEEEAKRIEQESAEAAEETTRVAEAPLEPEDVRISKGEEQSAVGGERTSIESDEQKELKEEVEENQTKEDEKEEEAERGEDGTRQTPERSTKQPPSAIPENARQAHCYMGFSLAEIKHTSGVKDLIIDSIDTTGPADLAGLKLNDTLIKIGDVDLGARGGMKKVKEAFKGAHVGEDLPIVIQRTVDGGGETENRTELTCVLIPFTDDSQFEGESYYFDNGSVEKTFSPEHGRPLVGAGGSALDLLEGVSVGAGHTSSSDVRSPPSDGGSSKRGKGGKGKGGKRR